MKYRKSHRLLKKKYIVTICIVLFVLIAAVIIISVASNARQHTQEQQAVGDQLREGLLRIGLRGDIDALCTYNGQTGEYEGLEKDIADELVSRIFHNDIIVEYVSVNSRTKDALLKIGDIDLSLGASINTGQSGICYTSPYFAEACGFLVMEGGITSQEGLSGGTVAVVQSSLPAVESEENKEKTKLDDYLAQSGITASVKNMPRFPKRLMRWIMDLWTAFAHRRTTLSILARRACCCLAICLCPTVSACSFQAGIKRFATYSAKR